MDERGWMGAEGRRRLTSYEEIAAALRRAVQRGREWSPEEREQMDEVERRIFEALRPVIGDDDLSTRMIMTCLGSVAGQLAFMPDDEDIGAPALRMIAERSMSDGYLKASDRLGTDGEPPT